MSPRQALELADLLEGLARHLGDGDDDDRDLELVLQRAGVDVVLEFAHPKLALKAGAAKALAARLSALAGSRDSSFRRWEG